ncbi:MAG: tetratricopeptide repeat protein [Kofleriaceae bacterium]|nr:tetratricopeptide repeat protein [Kofleriaceae bacterium]MCB9574068.1 tetratricopeptide repeat protein [Kofleriaceae bacterium]
MASLAELEAAVQTVESAPHSTAAWEEVEGLASDLEKPDDVIALYRRVLAVDDLASDIIEMIGARAASFCDEWFGDDPKVAEGLLQKVLARAPQSETALQRLSVIYAAAERWPELFALYDRALDAIKDRGRSIRLLREASQLAKDVAGQPEMAIGYLQRLLPLTPDDAQLSQSLERLLERHEKWADLIALWENRLETQSRKDRERTRARIAGCFLDNLHDAARALAAVRPLLGAAEDDTEACQLLERIIEASHTHAAVREGALDLLRAHYDSTGRPREVIRVLERVIAIDPSGSQALREEAGARLAELDDDAAAMDQYAALLALSPDSSVTQEKLRQLAGRANDYARYAAGVAAAVPGATTVARRVELLAEAARTRVDLLDDPAGAAELYQRALAEEGVGDKESLLVCRRLADLYGRTERQRERLDILARLGDLETADAARRAVLGEAARLAESLGETDRALELWRRRIEHDATDLSAIDALVALLESASRWTELNAALELRAGAKVTRAQKKSDLMRIASVHAEQLDDAAAAIDAWQRVMAEFGEDPETVGALADLLAGAGRWKEFADLLERSAHQDTVRTTVRLVRLADALREQLDEPERALTSYRAALAIDVRHGGARQGLLALLEVPTTRRGAADALAASFRDTADWSGFLDILPARLAEAPDARTRLTLLREAAQIRLDHTQDQAGALRDLADAFPLAPRDGVIEGQLAELARATGDHAAAAAGYAAAIAALADDPHEAARLRLVHADLLEGPLADDGGALAGFAAAAATQPGNLRAVQGVVRIAPRLGRWNEAAVAVLGYTAARDRYDAELWGSLTQAAAETEGGFDGAAAAVASTIAATELSAAVAAEVHHLLARWHRDHRSDAAAAIVELERTLAAGGDRLEPLAELAALLREQPPTATLLDVLRRLADADARELDVLVEAADTASRLGDRDASVELLGLVLGRATAAWRGGSTIRSSRPAESVVRWALDGLVELRRNGGEHRAAVDLLTEAARLPFDDTTRRELRVRAAEMAEADLGDTGAAIDTYRSVLAAAPGDLETIGRLGGLLEKEGRVAELLGLRKIQLGLETDPERRLELRLDIGRLVGVVEEQGGRLEALLANLADRPGHDASVDAIATFLAGKGQHGQLADVLEKQAALVEQGGDDARAARLWARYAGVTEHDTHEVERAIAGHRRVVALHPTPESLRALARLYVDRGQPGAAVPWYESLLGAVPAAERPAVVLQTARAHIAAGAPDRAISAIESHLDDAAPAVELRQLLAELYRDGAQWEPLARHLTRSLGVIGDQKLAGDMAREAASIYTHKLDTPAKAIPALEKALEVDPGDKELRAQLATGLRVAGRLGDARTILNELIDDFGRRRSPERAALHVELARVAQAEGKLDEALSEMEKAAKMDVNNATIQRGLAEMARAAGQLDKAERTYRALLLVVRRQPPGDEEGTVGPSEVLFELHAIAKANGQDDQARELLESAIDAAVQSDAEVHRLRRSLLAHGETDTLLRVLEMRLGLATEAASLARLNADRAEVLASTGRSVEALDAVLKALEHAPQRLDLHDRARVLARDAGQTPRYIEAVDTVADRLRRKTDPPLVATLLMKAGEALEQDASDLRGAAGMYRRVEMMGERLAEAYYAQARIAGALGDTEEQARALDAMLQLAGSESVEPAPEQVDALYRLAEIFIGTPTRRAQGIRLIERAFAAEPRWAQAGRVLKIATTQDASEPAVMALYERVARNGGDSELLLDFLEKRAGLADATPSQIREAVDVAVELGQPARAEALLVRAVEAARQTVDGVAGAVWAVVALTQRRIAQGQLEGARDLVYEIAPIAEPDQVDPLALEVAGHAATAGDGALAADVYEFLRERNPADRAVWEPLIALYRKLGDADRLANVVSSTLPNITEPSERNALRLAHARYLIEEQQRPHDALDVLRDALLDDPDHLEVAALLEDTLRATGDNDGLADFLWGRFEDAQKRGNRASIVDVANRLGALLDGQGNPEAARVYRTALEHAPDDRDLLRQVVAHLGDGDDPREGALLMERLLAVETPEAATQLCWQLASMWEAAGDDAGVQRTLELANGSAPDDAAIHDRLEQWYRDRSLWAELAELKVRDAARATDDEVAVAQLREAASVYSGFLGRPIDAARVLREARARRPGAPELVTELAAALAAADQLGEAITAIGEAVDGDEPAITGAGSVDLLLLRASLSQQVGDEGAAVADLERANTIDPARSASALAGGLERQRARAEAAGDLDAERVATLRLAGLLTQTGDLERARGLVVGWIERDPRDPEPLYMLRDMDASIEHWDGVIAACTRLAYIVEGQEQIDAAMQVADAAGRVGRPGDAVAVLELVHQQQPASMPLRDRLRELYEAAGAFRELAGVLLADADHGDDPALRFANYKRASELLLQLGDAAAALEPARKACELQPEDQAAAMLYVDALMNAGHVEQAAQALETAIGAHKKRSPELAVLQQRMGRVCALMNDKDGHLAWLKKAFDVDRKNGEVAAELAQLATETGDYELALKPLRAITLMENPYPVTRPMALLWEAKIEHARGNRAKAELWAKKALREDPAFSEAQQFLDEIS